MKPEQEKQVLESLYDRLYDAVTYAPEGKDGAFPKNVYFQMTKNQVLNPDDFADMMSPVNPNGNQGMAEYFSRMVDVVPKPGVLWSDSGNTITGLVDDVLARANANSEPDPEQQETYEAAYNFLNTVTETKDYKGNVKKKTDPSDVALAYDEAQSAYIAAVSGYRTAYNAYDLSKVEDQRAWNAQAPMLQNLVDKTWNAWARSGKAEVEEAQAALASTINNAVRHAIAQQQERSGDAYKLPPSTPAGYPWLPSYASPSNWADATGIKLTLSSASLNKTASSSARTYGVEGAGSYGLFHATVGVDGEHKEERAHMDAQNLEFSAELIAVQIMRPWFNPLLMGMTGWSVEGLPPGSLSNGDPAAPDGAYPLIPTSFVVARNVTIKADFSEDDKHFISNTVNTSVSGGWGPFTLKAKYGYSSSKSEETATLDGGTLTFPGLQLIAWISTVPPVSPPQ